MAKMKESSMHMGHGTCAKCHGSMKLVAGLVLLGTVLWAPGNEWLAVGAMLTLGGLLKMVKPVCPHYK